MSSYTRRGRRLRPHTLVASSVRPHTLVASSFKPQTLVANMAVATYVCACARFFAVLDTLNIDSTIATSV